MQSLDVTNLNVKLVTVSIVWRISSPDGEWASVRLIGLVQNAVSDSDVFGVGSECRFVCVCRNRRVSKCVGNSKSASSGAVELGRTRQITCRKSGIPENALALGDVMWNSALLWLRAPQIDCEFVDLGNCGR